MSEFWRWSLAEQSRAVGKGEATPTELVEASLARIEALEEQGVYRHTEDEGIVAGN